MTSREHVKTWVLQSSPTVHGEFSHLASVSPSVKWSTHCCLFCMTAERVSREHLSGGSCTVSAEAVLEPLGEWPPEGTVVVLS